MATATDDSLRDRVAFVLDMTHACGERERGPRTFLARERLATWLDLEEGRPLLKDVQHLERVAATTAAA